MVFFYPKTVESRQSKISGEIQVVKFFGSYRLVAGGYTQSGGLVEAIWAKVLQDSEAQMLKENPDILILGLGAGSAAHLAASYWPKSNLVGIEIDPVMIELGEKYFQLREIRNLEVIQDDAFAWLKKNLQKKKSRKFDLILVDIYMGDQYPQAMVQKSFITNLKKSLTENGRIIFNFLQKQGERSGEKELKSRLLQSFSKVKRLKSPANAVFLVRK